MEPLRWDGSQSRNPACGATSKAAQKPAPGSIVPQAWAAHAKPTTGKKRKGKSTLLLSHPVLSFVHNLT